MKRLRFVGAILIAVVMAGAAPTGDRVHALGQPASIGQETKAPSVTLKLTVVISRFQADKKTSSLPFVLMVVPGPIVQTKEGSVGADGDGTTLQMGAEVPVITTALAGPQTVPSYQYRSVGTNISSLAKVADDGRFNVSLNVSDSQVMSDITPAGAAAGPLSIPRFQSFRSANRLLLRDGQTVQFTAATDKSSGEVVKLDVTLNVIK